MPWNQRTILGWIAEGIYSMIAVGFYLIIAPKFLALFVSVCEYHRAFYQMFELQINEVDRMAQTKPFRYREIKQLLSESVSFHISVKK